MKFTHAIWEQRNMGVDCWEVEIENGDSEEEFLKNREKFETEYTVVKVPTNKSKFNFFLQNQGYQYVETMISLHRDISVPELNRIEKRIISEMEYTHMVDSDIERLLNEIKLGMFTTDRVYLDPYFSKEQAKNRYIGWIKDELNLGANLYNIRYREENVGFFILREMDNRIMYPAIAGIYQNVKTVGLGLAIDYFQIIESGKRKSKYLVASVSTNNIGALTILIRLGYSIDKLEAVYVKHCKRRGGSI